MKRHIPNLITLCNLLCGTLAAYCAISGRFEEAALFIIGGIVFDFFDGLSARMLKVASPLGKELDSLADVVTSGVAPAFILFNILWDFEMSVYLKYLALLIPLFSAYRLAKFNLDTRQSHSFIGLPTPANALFWVGIALWLESSFLNDWGIFNTQSLTAFIHSDMGFLILAILSILLNICLISEIPMFALKFQNLTWKDNKLRYCFIIGCIILIAMMGYLGISASILLYIIMSLFCLRNNSNTQE